MADQAKNLTVQWCYAAPTDILNSLDMPALTNFRVSNDFCYGESWNVGVSSLIVWASKPVLQCFTAYSHPATPPPLA